MEHEPPGGARPLLWRDSLRMSAARLWTGFGPETFPAAFAPFESVDLAHLYPDFYHESPHNVALDALTSTGIPGLALALGWVVLGFFAATGALRAKSKSAAPLAAGVVASITAAMFSAAVMPPLLLTLLLIAILTASETPDRSGFKATSPSLAFGFAFPVSAAIAAFALLLAVSDYRLELFQQSPGVKQYKAMLSLPVPVAAEDIYCSRVLARACGQQYECWSTAVHAAARATRTADDPANAWYNLAQFTAAVNDVRGTGNALAMASQAAPNWFKPHWAMAELLSKTGDAAGSRAEAERAVSLAATHDVEVSRALSRLTARNN